MLFYLFSLEKLYNRNFHAKYFLIGIVAVAIHMFSITMDFQAKSFYLQHFSIYYWGALWMVMFAYFHICAFTQRKSLGKNISSMMVLIALLALADVSFLLTLAYSVWGYSHWGLNACTDAASIWCTFAVVQVLTVPLLLSFLPKVLKEQPAKTELPKKTALKYLLISLLILGLSIILFPFYKCFTIKSVFP